MSLSSLLVDLRPCSGVPFLLILLGACPSAEKSAHLVMERDAGKGCTEYERLAGDPLNVHGCRLHGSPSLSAASTSTKRSVRASYIEAARCQSCGLRHWTQVGKRLASLLIIQASVSSPQSKEYELCDCRKLYPPKIVEEFPCYRTSSAWSILAPC